MVGFDCPRAPGAVLPEGKTRKRFDSRDSRGSTSPTLRLVGSPRDRLHEPCDRFRCVFIGALVTTAFCRGSSNAGDQPGLDSACQELRYLVGPFFRGVFYPSYQNPLVRTQSCAGFGIREHCRVGITVVVGLGSRGSGIRRSSRLPRLHANIQVGAGVMLLVPVVLLAVIVHCACKREL